MSDTRLRASRPSLLLALLALATAPCHGDGALPVAGHYVLAVQLMMPNLEEMREITVRDERCLATGEVDGLFPVLSQNALRGCRLGHAQRSADGTDYTLRCASASVASGTARIAADSDGALVGYLQVKMGGKNMTFSQRSVARRAGDCPTTSPSPPGH